MTLRSQPHPLNWEKSIILPHVYDTLIKDDTPRVHEASMAQNLTSGSRADC